MAFYPPRRYEEGLSPIQIKSMGHCCFLNRIDAAKEFVGDDVWESIKESCLGVFLKLNDMEKKYTWSAQTVHYFLTNQLQVKNKHEFWSVIDGLPLRFSLNEFAEITGLNCDPINQVANLPDPSVLALKTELWNHIGISENQSPSYNDLLRTLKSGIVGESAEKKKLILKLIVLHVGIYGLHAGSRMPYSAAVRVFDEEQFVSYPWGRECFSALIRSIRECSFVQDTYTVHGCVHALLIWVYESVPGIGELQGQKREGVDGPGLLQWAGGRNRYTIEEFLVKEKDNHKEVRVRHMCPVTQADKYPYWPDNEEQRDASLDKLLDDIIEDRFDPKLWPIVETKKKKKKRKSDKVDDETKGNVSKKKKIERVDEADGNACNEKKSGRNDDSVQDDSETMVAMSTVKKFVIDAVKEAFDELVKKFTLFQRSVDGRLSKMDEAIKDLKQAGQHVTPKSIREQVKVGSVTPKSTREQGKVGTVTPKSTREQEGDNTDDDLVSNVFLVITL